MAHSAVGMIKQLSLLTHALPDAAPDTESTHFEIDVPPDGSCLFYSLALSFLLPVLQDNEAFAIRFTRLFGKVGLADDAPERLRQLLSGYDGRVEFIEQHVVELEVLVDTGFRAHLVEYMRSRETEFSQDEYQEEKSFESAMSSMASAKTWGGHRELAAASQYLERVIVVYEKGSGKLVERARYNSERYRHPLYVIRTSVRPGGNVFNHYHYLLLPEHLPIKQVLASASPLQTKASASAEVDVETEEKASTLSPWKFQFYSKDFLRKFLAEEFEAFQGGEARRQPDAILLSRKIDKLLKQPPRTQQTFVEDLNHRLKAFGQLRGVSGYATTKMGVSGKTQLPTKSAQIEEEGKDESYSGQIPDSAHPDTVSFDGWEQVDFLLFSFHFFINAYLQAKKSKVEQSRLEGLFRESGLNLERLKTFYLHELWIVLNAYSLRTTYVKIIAISNEQLRHNTLKQFIESFITFMKNAKDDEYDFCLPAGYVCPTGSKDNGHAIYLVMDYEKSEKMLTIRIDNPSDERIKIFRVNIDEEYEILVKYLSDVCLGMQASCIHGGC